MIPGYRIGRELGRGGMATVYLAVQESLNREVALKVLAPALANDEDFSERFLREAQIAGRFRHRHLVSVYDAGRVGEQLYLAMEYIPGGSAADLRDGDPEQIRRCVVEIANALAYAHAQGVVHRDIKPDNILRREDGSFVLSDFGIARSSEHAKQLTGPQAALGTPAYMSPEQWRNQFVDGRADLYSLGIVLYELLTGRPPFTGADGLAIGLQHLQAPRPVLPPSRASWQPVLDRLVAIAPSDRFESASDVALALGGVAHPSISPQPSAATVEIATPHSAAVLRNRPMVWLAVTLAVLAAAGYVAKDGKSARPATLDAGAQAAKRDIAPQPAAANIKSIAVLPFRVLSSSAEDALFADGLSEEILTTLAAITELKVAGRTSSFAWRDKQADLREIANALGVAHVLEGSVRRAGKQLRISATLIDARDGTTQWSANFDRGDADAFDIQSEIAKAVADRLAVSIGTRALPTMARLPTAERVRYLEAIGLLRKGQPRNLAAVRKTLRSIIDSHDVGPDAMLRLIFVAAEMIRYKEADPAVARREQAEMTELLSTRFPDTIERRIAAALDLQSRADLSGDPVLYQQALDIYQELIATSPNDGLLALNASHVARISQKFDLAIAFAERGVAIEPDDPVAHVALSFALSESGATDAAMERARYIAERWPDSQFAKEFWPWWLSVNGLIAEAIVVTGQCEKSQFTDHCLTDVYRWRKLLGLDRSASATLRKMEERDKTGRHEAQIWKAIESGGQVEPGWIDGSTVYEAVGAAMREALARGDLESFSAIGARRFGKNWPAAPPANEINTLRSGAPIWAAMSAAAQGEISEWRKPLLELDTKLHKVPIAALTEQNSQATIVATLVGDTDQGMARLDALSTRSPLFFDRLVRSHTGRELPLMRELLAHPKFARLQANRDAVVARERALIQTLRPDLD